MLQTRPSTWNAITKSTINGQWRTVARPPAKPPRDAYLGKPTGRPRIDACSSRRDRQAPQSHQLRIRYAGEDKEGYPYREERPFRETLEAEATVQGASRSFDQETPGSPFLNLLKQCAARHPRDRCSPRIPCSQLRTRKKNTKIGSFFFFFRVSGSESDGLGKCSKSTRGGARQRRKGDRGRGPLRRREQLGPPLRWLRDRAEVKTSTWPCREPTEWSWTSCTGELVVEGQCHPREVG